MNAMKPIFWLIVFSIFFLTGCAQMETVDDQAESLSFRERAQINNNIEMVYSPIEEQLAQMTVEEKIGQLLIVGMEGTTYGDQLDKLIRQHHVGGIILLGKNISTADQIVGLLNHAKTANKEYGIPLFLSVDEEGGRVSRLPTGLKKSPSAAKVGNKNDETLAYDSGVYLGELLNAFGYNMNYAPVLDVNSNTQNPVIGDRSYSADPAQVTEVALAVRRGMIDQQIISVVKHFPGHGDTHTDSHKALPVINKSLEELQKTELIPFRQAIADHVDVIMVAHILFPTLDPTNPSSLSKRIIDGLLRNEMGYDGVVITDDLTMGAIINDYTVAEAALKSFLAGSDLLLIVGDYKNQIETVEKLDAAVATGTITEERLNESVRRILQLKARYGLEDNVKGEFDVNVMNKRFKELIR
ncbi:beta-N-acetylhexosaminidase [Sporosarcina oncorhynchi]|uniref:Beta-N-acetylhexosaminidase n=1 Tax=Sporosarcina oncorhynchi TaxID=3056444 RepID=A0ABZ0L8W2_9BACL|nr:beta-N-acetylhexosaminidase [Sporosarcina sp. T2O-4]WOV88518.1 beta-N-acetylhexosaminidase [Sporosarcina sp. T2O-4]